MIPAWKFFDEFHEVIERFAYFGVEPRRLLDRLEAAPLLLDWFMGPQSLLRTRRSMRSKARTASQGSKSYQPKYGPLLRAVSMLVRACRVPAQRVSGASSPPTLVTYGHEEPNEADRACHAKSMDLQTRVQHHNKTRRDTPIKNADKLDQAE